jgi:hypothetical protein
MARDMSGFIAEMSGFRAGLKTRVFMRLALDGQVMTVLGHIKDGLSLLGPFFGACGQILPMTHAVHEICIKFVSFIQHGEI